MMTSFASLLLAASAVALTPQIAMARQAGAPVSPPPAPPVSPAAPASSAAPVASHPSHPSTGIHLNLDHKLLLQERQLERQMEGWNASSNGRTFRNGSWPRHWREPIG